MLEILKKKKKLRLGYMTRFNKFGWFNNMIKKQYW